MKKKQNNQPTHHINVEVSEDVFFGMRKLSGSLRIKGNPRLAERLFRAAIAIGEEGVRELIGPEKGDA